jgi:outer membrane murein-binding lipoprotein Lpp
MKLKLVAVAVTSLLAAGAVNAAEVYNKDGNKLDLYGKVHALHYFSDDTAAMATKPTRVWASKVKLRSTTSWLVTASGNMSSKATVLNPRVLKQTKLVWHSLV